MNNKEILDFKNAMADLSLTDLEKLSKELQGAIGKMVLDMDLVMKAAIVDSLIQEKKNG